jgi:hypothetical protein
VQCGAPITLSKDELQELIQSQEALMKTVDTFVEEVNVDSSEVLY